MSINLLNVALHKLVKNDQEELVVNFRSDSLENNVSSENLVSEIHRAFSSKKNKSFCVFNSGSDVKQWVDELIDIEMGFYEFSHKSAKRLKDELSKYPFADEGTVVFAEYQTLANSYLFIGLIPSKYSLTVTDGLEIGAGDYLDISKMDIAATIDLTTYELEEDSLRYITLIKDKAGRRISNFFFDFLGAEVGLNVKHQNQVLRQAVEDFVSDSKLDKEEALSYKKQVLDYCKDQQKHGEEVSVKEMSGELSANDAGESFFDYTEDQGYELADSFPVDKSVLKSLTKFTGSGGGLNINFDALILGERIFYDADTDTLTIKGTPPNLRDQLTRASK